MHMTRGWTGSLSTPRGRRRKGRRIAAAAAITISLIGTSQVAAHASNSENLVVWSFQGSSSDRTAGIPYAFNLIDKNFEAVHPNIHVDMITQPFDNYRPLFAAAAAAQTGPDVWESLPGAYTSQYASALLPLNQYVTPKLRSSLTGWSGVIVPQWQDDGTIYGIPSETQGNVWYYNKALFKQAGLTKPPSTWPELIADCKTLLAHHITPLANGTADDNGALNYIDGVLPSMVPASQMTGLITGKLSWTSPAVEKSLQLLEDLVPYYEKGFTGLLFEGPGSDLFPGGHTAMIPGLTSNNNNYYQYEQALGKNDVGVFRAPVIPGYQKYARQIGLEGDYSWTVTRWAHDKSAAVEYDEFMTTPASQKILLDYGGDIPNLTSVPASWFSGTAVKIENIIKTASATPPPPAALMDSALSTYFGQQMDDVFTGSESVSSAAKNIQSEVSSGS